MTMLSCIAPQQIEAGDLAAYIDGTAEKSVVQHILNCAFCQHEVAELKKADLLLTNQLFREDCPEPVQLLQYQAGFLDEAEETAVAGHIATCSHCTQELRQLAMEETASEAPAPTAGPSLLDKLRQAGLNVLEAIRLPDPPQLDLAVRGQQEIGQIYQAGDYQLVVGHQTPDFLSEGITLEGQLTHLLTGEPVAEGLITLHDATGSQQQASLDSFGYFEFEELASGQYVIEVVITGTAFMVEIDIVNDLGFN